VNAEPTPGQLVAMARTLPEPEAIEVAMRAAGQRDRRQVRAVLRGIVGGFVAGVLTTAAAWTAWVLS
jgi:hypothetical protein